MAAMAFSAEEFNIMVDELLYREEVSFDMLCRIAEKTLKPSVRKWCYTDSALCGKGLEDEIMQEIYIRLIKTCVSSFLLRQGVDGPVNLDPDGFRNWMFKVAVNIKRDFANRVRRTMSKEDELDQAEEVPDQCGPGEEWDEERTERLSSAFEIVLSSDLQVYKVLTWLAQGLYMIQLDITRIQSNELILRTFEEKTLYEMRDMLFDFAKRVPWIRITPEQDQKIESALRKLYDENRCYGMVPYREFFMKKGGKATISDWVNRMNSMIKRVMIDEAHNS